MDTVAKLHDKYFKWISLKAGVIFLAVWGMADGIFEFEKRLVFSFEMIDSAAKKPDYTIHNVYGAIQIFTDVYHLCMSVIISFYLLCATIAEFPSKSSFVMSWVIYAAIANTYTLLNLIYSSIKSYRYFTRFFYRYFSLTCCQFGFLVIVFCYYKTLPKRKFTWN